MDISGEELIENPVLITKLTVEEIEELEEKS